MSKIINCEESNFQHPAVTAAKKPFLDVRRMVFTAVMAAISIVLSELLSFNVPFMPGFISLDFSDVPALLASVTMGPVSGVCVCLLKNVWGMITTQTGCVGELSNFILSAALVLPVGILARKKHSYPRVIIGCAIGIVLSGLISIASNYFIVFPAYSVAFNAPIKVIVDMYNAILPGTDSLIKALLIFNMPFTMLKGLIAALFSLPLYKRLKPVFNTFERE